MKGAVNGVTTNYFYSGSVVISEKQGSTWTDYIFFGNQRIAQQTGSSLTTAKFLHADHLNSTRGCTDATGNSAGTCDYEPFGEVQPGTTCSVPTNYRFAGMEWDSETSLYHTWFRQYDMNQGRWMSVDPLPGSPDNPQSLDRYTYVLNDPVNLVDPSGLFCFVEFHWALFDAISYHEGNPYISSSWVLLPSLRCEPERLDGDGGGPGGGTHKRDVVKEFSGTFQCNVNASEAIKALEKNFSSFGNYSSAEGYVVFSPGAVVPGQTIRIDSTLNVPAVPRAFTSDTSAVTVGSVTQNSFTFETVQGHPFYPGTITFRASDAGKGQITFSVDVNSNFANMLSRVGFSLGGQAFEKNIWTNLINNVKALCEKGTSGK